MRFTSHTDFTTYTIYIRDYTSLYRGGNLRRISRCWSKTRKSWTSGTEAPKGTNTGRLLVYTMFILFTRLRWGLSPAESALGLYLTEHASTTVSIATGERICPCNTSARSTPRRPSTSRNEAACSYFRSRSWLGRVCNGKDAVSCILGVIRVKRHWLRLLQSTCPSGWKDGQTNARAAFWGHHHYQFWNFAYGI